MKYVSWNVNGIRAALKKGFNEFVTDQEPDVLCVQETKANGLHVELPGYVALWNDAERKGYSGTACFVKRRPISFVKGIGVALHDSEGRVITLEYEDHYLVNVYVPNAGRDLARLAYRKEWDRAFLEYALRLPKPVILCGDFNVAHAEIDLARPKQNTRNAGFTPEERAGFQAFVDAGFVDTFRHFTKEGGHYTWWSYMFNARAKNIGWRIDYFLAKGLDERLAKAEILSDVLGSDHCPVALTLR